MFIGRTRELARLREEYAANRPSLLVIYGRRRVGKSELLREVNRTIPHVHYQATRVSSGLNLEAFKTEIGRSLGGDNLLQGIMDWLGVLTYLARKAEASPGLVVVLDEFPYLVDADNSLPSVVQKFWDSGEPAKGKLNLVLCGSLISQMESLLAERNPLYGRKTLAMDVWPLPLRDAARFFPSYSAEDRLAAYGIFGGIPFYLRFCDPGVTLEQNVKTLLLTNSGALIDEPTFLLQSELREIQRYSSILAAIAAGCTKLGEISGRIRDISDSTRLTPYIEKLERMRLVRAVQSMDAAEKSRDRRYHIADPLMSFWHRFVLPYLSTVNEGNGQEVWKFQVAPRLDEFMGGAFEDMCRDHARKHLQESLIVPAREVGQLWAADYDIDVAGQLLDGSMLYGECKWRRIPVGEDVLYTLMDRAVRTAYGRGEERRHFVLYARTGFTQGVLDAAGSDARIVLHTPDTMLNQQAVPAA